MTKPCPLPDGFGIGHWTEAHGGTGCTVVIPPAGTRGAVEIRGGGTSTRDIEALDMLANAEGPNALLLTGGSAFGLAAAEGIVRWLEERGVGRPTRSGPVPLVCGAVIYDLSEKGRRPGPDAGYAACERAAVDACERGPVGAGAGAAVGKLLGRERSTSAGVGLAATELSTGVRVGSLAVANALGDVVGADGGLIGSPHDEAGNPVRTAELIQSIAVPSELAARPEENTTLVCICTDASLDKRSCAIVARMASAGIARAVDPVFSPFDGDAVFCLASGSGPTAAPGLAASWALAAIGAAAATVTATAIRDAVGPRVK